MKRFNIDTFLYVAIAALGAAQMVSVWNLAAFIGIALVALTAWKAKRSQGLPPAPDSTNGVVVFGPGKP